MCICLPTSSNKESESRFLPETGRWWVPKALPTTVLLLHLSRCQHLILQIPKPTLHVYNSVVAAAVKHSWLFCESQLHKSTQLPWTVVMMLANTMLKMPPKVHTGSVPSLYPDSLYLTLCQALGTEIPNYNPDWFNLGAEVLQGIQDCLPSLPGPLNLNPELLLGTCNCILSATRSQ